MSGEESRELRVVAGSGVRGLFSGGPLMLDDINNSVEARTAQLESSVSFVDQLSL